MNRRVYRVGVDRHWDSQNDLVLISRHDYARDPYRWKCDVPGPEFGLKTYQMPGNILLYEHIHFEIIPDSLFNSIRNLSREAATEVYYNSLNNTSVSKDYTYITTPNGTRRKIPKDVVFADRPKPAPLAVKPEPKKSSVKKRILKSTTKKKEAPKTATVKKPKVKKTAEKKPKTAKPVKKTVKPVSKRGKK